MADSEKLDLILSQILDMKSEIQDIRSGMQDMKSEIQDIRSGMQDMKSEIQDIRSEMQDMKSEVHEIKQRTANIELHIENVTDKNTQLIAENFIELTKKLNQAIPVADKNLAFEVKVNYLICELDKLKKEISELKNRNSVTV